MAFPTICCELSIAVPGGPVVAQFEVAEQLWAEHRTAALDLVTSRLRASIEKGLAYYDEHPEELKHGN